MNFIEIVETAGKAIDLAGVFVIVMAALISTSLFLRSIWRDRTQKRAYTDYRRRLARGLLLGLEFLVAADIIRTVAIDPSLESIVVLGGIVLIRTFLSFSLELEINGRFPWQKEAG